MDATKEKVRKIFWQHYGNTSECWAYQINRLKSMAEMASDHLSYYEIIHRAEKCLAENDLQGARLCYFRAMELLPKAEEAGSPFQDTHIVPVRADSCKLQQAWQLQLRAECLFPAWRQFG